MPTPIYDENIALTLGDTFSADKNFAEVVFQRAKPVLDTELTEMQRVASYREKFRAMLFGSIFLADTFKVIEKVGAENDFSLKPGEFSSGSLLYLAKNQFDYKDQVFSAPFTRKLLWNADVRVPALTTPTAQRVDLVVLTLVTRVISGTEDPSLINSLVNQETALRTKIEAGITVIEGFTGEVSNLDQHFAYENSEHCFRFPLALLNREAGNASITSSMIVDLRSRVVFEGDVIPFLHSGGLSLPGNLTVEGDFTVKGTQTVIDTTELDVKDNLVRLNKGVTGTPVLDAGIEVVRGSATNAQMVWDESAGRWSCGLLGALHSIAYDEEVIHLQGAETISGVKTFTVLPKSAVDPSTADEFSRRGYVDSELSKGLLKKLDKTLLATKGDLSYADADGSPTTLPAGSEKQVLTIVNGLPVWRDVEAGQAQLEGVLDEAKAYTDSAISEVNLAVDAGDEGTLSAAKTYADGKGTSVLNEAKSYTDEKTSNISAITTLESYFTDGSAKNALSLGGTAAALWAKLSDLAGYATTLALSALGTRVSNVEAYFTNGVAKLAAKLATAVKINGVSFDGSSDISVDHLVDFVLQSSVKAEILAAMNDSVGVFRVFSGLAGLTDAPDPQSSWRYQAIRFPGGNIRVVAIVPGGLTRQECVYTASNTSWSNWTVTQDVSGNASNANSLGGSAASLWAKLTDLASYATTSTVTALTNRVADLETMGVVSKTASGSFTLSAANKMWLSNSTGALTFTIPADSTANFAVGSRVEVMRYNTGPLLLAPASGVALYSYGASSSASYYVTGRWAVVTLIKIAANVWVVVGDVSTT